MQKPCLNGMAVTTKGEAERVDTLIHIHLTDVSARHTGLFIYIPINTATSVKSEMHLVVLQTDITGRNRRTWPKWQRVCLAFGICLGRHTATTFEASHSFTQFLQARNWIAYEFFVLLSDAFEYSVLSRYWPPLLGVRWRTFRNRELALPSRENSPLKNLAIYL